MQKTKKTIPIFWPYIPKKKILKEISHTLSGRWLGQGPKVDQFEKEFGKAFGYRYPLFVNSGTAALELSYHLIGLKPGDEVVTTVLTCTATNIPLIRKGVKIVFADIDRKTLNIDPSDVERKITKKTKAIVAVHLGGILVDDRIFKIGKKYKIPIVVDSAQYHAPSKGDYVCYSFQAIKHITTCDGGMLVLNNQKEYKRAKLLRWFGIDRELKARKNYQAWEKREMTFDIEEAGYKWQPTDIDACFGLAALPDLPKVIKYSKSLADEYLKNLKPRRNVITPVAGGSNWLFGVLTEDRDDLAEYLTNKGVENNMVHLRNDIFEIFKPYKSPCPNMDWVEPRYLYLPINTKVTRDDVRYICKEIRSFYGTKKPKIVGA